MHYSPKPIVGLGDSMITTQGPLTKPVRALSHISLSSSVNAIAQKQLLRGH